jgi:hypothetical protein
MACMICRYIGQYSLNLLNLLDHAGNTFLLGDANETISARTARARNAGQKWAITVCSILTYLAKAFTFWTFKGDHCTYALNASILPNSREIWNWDDMSIRPVPETIIDDVEILDIPNE